MNSALKRTIWKIVYLVITFGSIALIAMLDDGLNSLGETFKVLNIKLFLLGIACEVLSWVVDGWMLWYSLRSVNAHIGFWSALRISMIGVFGSAITPLASGGQPLQIYYLGRYNVKGASATSALLLKFVGFQSMLLAISIVALITQYHLLAAKNSIVIVCTWIGIGYSMAMVAVLILVGINKKVLLRIGWSFTWIGVKLRIIKNQRSVKRKILRWVAEYIESLNIAKANIGKMVFMCIGNVILIVSMLMTTYFLYLSLGLREHSILMVLSLQAFLYNSVSFIPIPGATGASEGAFYIFFGMIFPQEYRFTAMLLWRISTYYISLVVGGAAMFIGKDKRKLINRPPQRLAK